MNPQTQTVPQGVRNQTRVRSIRVVNAFKTSSGAENSDITVSNVASSELPDVLDREKGKLGGGPTESRAAWLKGARDLESSGSISSGRRSDKTREQRRGRCSPD